MSFRSRVVGSTTGAVVDGLPAGPLILAPLGSGRTEWQPNRAEHAHVTMAIVLARQRKPAPMVADYVTWRSHVNAPALCSRRSRPIPWPPPRSGRVLRIDP